MRDLKEKVNTNDLTNYISIIVEKSPNLIVMSNPNKDSNIIKVDFRKLEDENIQMTSFTKTQAFHQNISNDSLYGFIVENFNRLNQLNAFTDNKEYTLRITKKGRPLFGSLETKRKEKEFTHNRQKSYIIPEGERVPALVDMGVFTDKWKIVKSMYDKYKQINRFLEIIDDEIKDYKKDSINILDFGCGKSYLTFIVYHYLTVVRGLNVNMVGLDIKKEVIEKCNIFAKKYGYNNLEFIQNRIEDYKPKHKIDMIITLHACDVATDYALFSGIRFGVDYIFSVPCCQHELNSQIESEKFKILTRYGIIKERFSALLTDSIRANLLETKGYSTQILEFVDLSHTPKNVLIRARKTSIPADVRNEKLEEVKNVLEEFNVKPMLWKLLYENENKN